MKLAHRSSMTFPLVVLFLLFCDLPYVAPADAATTTGSRASTSRSSVPSLAFSGTAVDFNLSGLEPDFDPIYKVVVSSVLHDPRTSMTGLPDTTLVLSAYLELFQPDTTPVLPDLLHQDQIAGNLTGFLSGKAALVNQGGRVVYHGSLLAEIFQNNTEHLVVDLVASDSGRPVRLRGAINLVRGGIEKGNLQVVGAMSHANLAVPRRLSPTWQAIVAQMSVRKPAMMGTRGSGGVPQPAQPGTIAPVNLTTNPSISQTCDASCRLRRPITYIPLVMGIALACIGAFLSLAHRATIRKRRTHGRSAPAEHTS